MGTSIEASREGIDGVGVSKTRDLGDHSWSFLDDQVIFIFGAIVSTWER